MQYIPFAKTVGPSNDAVYLSCLHMNMLYPALVSQRPWSLPCSVAMGLRAKQQPSRDKKTEKSRGEDGECDPLDGTSFTALDNQVTDGNFMPFRLRFRANKCHCWKGANFREHRGARRRKTKRGQHSFEDEHHAARALNLNLKQEQGQPSRLVGDKTGHFRTSTLLGSDTAPPGHISRPASTSTERTSDTQYHSTQLLFLPLLAPQGCPSRSW